MHRRRHHRIIETQPDVGVTAIWVVMAVVLAAALVLAVVLA